LEDSALAQLGARRRCRNAWKACWPRRITPSGCSRARAARNGAQRRTISWSRAKVRPVPAAGLFRFLKFIEHSAKPRLSRRSRRSRTKHRAVDEHSPEQGLEFPVVAVADLAKPFNTQDLRGEIILTRPSACVHASSRRTRAVGIRACRTGSRNSTSAASNGRGIAVLYVATTAHATHSF